MIIFPISQQDADNFILKLTKQQANPKNYVYTHRTVQVSFLSQVFLISQLLCRYLNSNYKTHQYFKNFPSMKYGSITKNKQIYCDYIQGA